MVTVHNPDREYLLRVERGEDLVEAVQAFCATHSIHAGWVQGLGACDKVTLSYYNLDEKKYEEEDFREEFEILSIVGNISTIEDRPFLHAHATLGRRDKSVIGGHLHYMRISGTGEVYIRAFEAKFTRSKDERTGLMLLEGIK